MPKIRKSKAARICLNTLCRNYITSHAKTINYCKVCKRAYDTGYSTAMNKKRHAKSKSCKHLYVKAADGTVFCLECKKVQK